MPLDLPRLSNCSALSSGSTQHGLKQEQMTVECLVWISSVCMQDEHPDELNDARMPLDLPGLSSRSTHSSGSTQRAESLKDSSGNNLRTADRRRSSSYGRVSLY